MYTTTKVLLLLTVLALLPCAEPLITSNQRCLCVTLQDRILPKPANITIYPETAFCGKLEIVLTMKDSTRLCLNPNSRQGRLIMRKRSRSARSTAN